MFNSDGTPKKASRMNDDLVKEKAYSTLEQKEVTAWLALRNHAAHGKYDEYAKEQVKAAMDGVHGFIKRHEA